MFGTGLIGVLAVGRILAIDQDRLERRTHRDRLEFVSRGTSLADATATGRSSCGQLVPAQPILDVHVDQLLHHRLDVTDLTGSGQLLLQ